MTGKSQLQILPRNCKKRARWASMVVWKPGGSHCWVRSGPACQEGAVVRLLRDYLDACDLVDRAVNERKAWGSEEDLRAEERAFLDAVEQVAIEHMGEARAALAKAMDARFLPTYEWEPRQAGPYFVASDAAERQRLVQETADVEGRHTVVRNKHGEVEAEASPSRVRTDDALTSLSRAFPARVAGRRRIGFGQ